MTVTVQRKPTEYHGCVIDHVCEVEVKSVTATIDQVDKLEFSNGKLALDLISNSYLYGEEVQLIYYTRFQPEIRRRVNGHNGFFRVELHLSKVQAAALVRGLMK